MVIHIGVAHGPVGPAMSSFTFSRKKGGLLLRGGEGEGKGRGGEGRERGRKEEGRKGGRKGGGFGRTNKNTAATALISILTRDIDSHL